MILFIYSDVRKQLKDMGVSLGFKDRLQVVYYESKRNNKKYFQA